MISLEKAKALKEAGLLWEPCFGEWVHVDGENKMIVHVCEGEFGDYKDIRYLSPFTGIAKGLRGLECVWLPSLSQLLAEIKKQGKTVKRLWQIIHQEPWYINLWSMDRGFNGDTPEDAAAAALLWLLGQEQKEFPEREQK
ncbi:MAG: hypothetical protein M0P69_13670 [Bacteroidales bacterium]|nr:hypothetical protein [Bacteroidales bacterium]